MSGKGEQDLDLNGQGSTSGHGQDNRRSAVPQELIKTANLLFSQLETGYVWSVCCTKFSIACQLESDDTTSRGADGRSILERSLSGRMKQNKQLNTYLLNLIYFNTNNFFG